MEEGRFLLDVTSQYHPLTRLVHGDDYVSFGELQGLDPAAAEHGDAAFYLFRTDLIGRYATSDRTEISLAVPYKRLSASVTQADEHHRNETAEGLGDMRLALKRYFSHAENFLLSASLGLSLPTGHVNRLTAASYLDHEAADDLGIEIPNHSHLQLGTGTFDPDFGLQALYRLDSGWMWFGGLDFRVPFTENRYDYRTAASGSLDIGPARHIEDTRLTAALFSEWLWAGRDRFDGDDIVGPGGTAEGTFGVPNTGRFEVSLKPTLTWDLGEGVTLNLQGRVPVYTRIHGGAAGGEVQLAESVGVYFGITTGF